jgi:hypothetical protein
MFSRGDRRGMGMLNLAVVGVVDCRNMAGRGMAEEARWQRGLGARRESVAGKQNAGAWEPRHKRLQSVY